MILSAASRSARSAASAAPVAARLRVRAAVRLGLLSSAERRRRRCQPVAPAAALGASQLQALLPGASALQTDLAAALLSGLGALACIKSCDTLAQLDLLDRKLTRKLVHIICGPGFVLAWLLFSDAPGARYVAALVPLLNGARLLAIGTGLLQGTAAVKAISREGDRGELLRGPLYYVGVMVFLTVAFWRDSPVGLVAISLMCGGDGFADVIGRRLGAGNRLPFNPAKSVAGSCAMFAFSLLFSTALLATYAHCGAFAVDWATALPVLALIAAAATMVEAAPLSHVLDDNISVPAVGVALTAAAAARGLLVQAL